MKTITKKLIITAIVGILAITIGAEISLAATATFIGSVDDDGGDPNLIAWFQYGKTTGYGYETSHQSKYGTGDFTATVSGLENCLTYHYRAASKHQNFDDPMYGQDKTFTTPCDNSPTVDIKANNSDGSIAIPYNTSATLTWTSTNANYCYASGAWSGSKAISDSESTDNLTYSKTYTITCTGLGGSASDSVTIYVQQVSGATNPTIQKMVRNLSDGERIFSESTLADPTEILEFQIQINSGSGAQNVTVKDVLPDRIILRANSLKLNGILASGDITSGIALGNLAQNQTKTITFWVSVAGLDKFNFGNTSLMNTATVYWSGDSLSDSATIIVTKKEVLGAATGVSTGLTDSIFVDSFFLPLVSALTLTWLFKSHILKWEEWSDERKKEYRKFKTEKLLRLKIAEIKAREFLKL